MDDSDPERPATHTEAAPQDFKTVAAMMMELAQNLVSFSQLPQRVAATAHQPREPGDLELIQFAEEELRRRRLRTKFLPDDMFGEAAWSILLDLFIHQHRGRAVSTKSACLASQVPQTTALRWLDVLETRHLIIRYETDCDRRVKLVALTTDGLTAVRAILRSYVR